eukprot:1188816-Amphidinium_carterae.1
MDHSLCSTDNYAVTAAATRTTTHCHIPVTKPMLKVNSGSSRSDMGNTLVGTVLRSPHNINSLQGLLDLNTIEALGSRAISAGRLDIVDAWAACCLCQCTSPSFHNSKACDSRPAGMPK